MISVKTGNAIALCYIIDEFESFIKDVDSCMPQGKEYLFSRDLRNISLKKKIFGKRKIKKFYKEHQWVIDTINKYSNIDSFLKAMIYDSGGRTLRGFTEVNLFYFYEYLVPNKENRGKILDLLEQIQILDFLWVGLDENADFTKEEYKIFPEPEKNEDNYPYFLENLERIPSYGEEIRYKSCGSHYKICFSYIDDKLKIDRAIILNSLLFDSKFLPIKACAPDFFEEIVSLKEEKKEECEQIRDSINLKVQLQNLEEKLASAKAMAKELSQVPTKEELKDSLCYMELELVRMKQMSSEYDENLLKNSPIFTEEILEMTRKK